MCARVAVVYNEPVSSRYTSTGEEKAVVGVLDAVSAVNDALLELGHDVVLVPLLPPIEEVKRKLDSLEVDLVFNLFEGLCGFPETEALLPEFLSKRGITYTGCSAALLRLALDKAKTKEIVKAGGIDTPDFQVLNPRTLSTFKLDFPCIVKPRAEDASHGLTEMSVVEDFASLERQVRLVSGSYGGEALVEEFIDGREFNATVLGDPEYTVLPVSEIVYSLPPGMPRILDFAAKWEKDSLYYQGTQAVCPAQISEGERERIAGTARATFRLLNCRGYVRVDMRLDRQERVNVIEVNPNPDISPGTGAARQAAAAGMTYTEFIEKLVNLALRNQACLPSAP